MVPNCWHCVELFRVYGLRHFAGYFCVFLEDCFASSTVRLHFSSRYDWLGKFKFVFCLFVFLFVFSMKFCFLFLYFCVQLLLRVSLLGLDFWKFTRALMPWTFLDCLLIQLFAICLDFLISCSSTFLSRNKPLFFFLLLNIGTEICDAV